MNQTQNIRKTLAEIEIAIPKLRKIIDEAQFEPTATCAYHVAEIYSRVELVLCEYAKAGFKYEIEKALETEGAQDERI